MKKSEQVIYITLIDFLLQLLFLGLVLWVIFGLSKASIPETDAQAVGGTEKAITLLRNVKTLMDKNGIQDPDILIKKIRAIVDFSGGVNQAAELINGVKELMRETKTHDPRELVNKLRSMIDAAGGLGGASELPALIKDVMKKAGMNDPKQLIKSIDAIIDETGGIQQASALINDLKTIMHASGETDLGKLVNALNELNKTQPDLTKAVELARLSKEIIDKTGKTDPKELIGLIEKGKQASEGTELKTDAPPYIALSEIKGFSFDTGSSKLNPDLRMTLETKVVEVIQQAIDKYHINLIEVIGHTDSQPVKRGSREMDEALETEARKPYDPTRDPKAVQGSNTDLGMLRALEVVKLLKHLRSQGKLKEIDPDTGFRAYSSGQLTLPDGRLSDGQDRDPDAARRRIEIRLTKLGEEARLDSAQPANLAH